MALPPSLRSGRSSRQQLYDNLQLKRWSPREVKGLACTKDAIRNCPKTQHTKIQDVCSASLLPTSGHPSGQSHLCGMGPVCSVQGLDPLRSAPSGGPQHSAPCCPRPNVTRSQPLLDNNPGRQMQPLPPLEGDPPSQFKKDSLVLVALCLFTQLASF